jgi:GH43 family beta-xylosidase
MRTCPGLTSLPPFGRRPIVSLGIWRPSRTTGLPPQRIQIIRWGPRSITPTNTNHSLGTPVYHPNKYKSFVGDPGLPPQRIQIIRWGPRSTTPTNTNHSLGTPVYHPNEYKSFVGDPGLPPQRIQIIRWGPRSTTPTNTNHSLGTLVWRGCGKTHQIKHFCKIQRSRG